MLVLLAVAAIAVLYCVVIVSQGRGGELTEFAPDVPPLELPTPRQLTAVDFMALRLPMSLVGYHTQTVDETLQRAAVAIGERDTHIAVLEQRVAELLAGRVQARQEAQTRPSWAPAPEPGPVRTGQGLAAAPHPLGESETLSSGPEGPSRYDGATGPRVIATSEPIAMPEEYPAPPRTFSGLTARPLDERPAEEGTASGLGRSSPDPESGSKHHRPPAPEAPRDAGAAAPEPDGEPPAGHGAPGGDTATADDRPESTGQSGNLDVRGT
ncbi:hypothetical protein ABZU32_30695 [Sphaerisporangium sp. NPDC005288]|uniref:hypothetical protein n=1 Tax=Sphaerisporangium sp. NPDC005288 TaxID=3155114 RepID=UPI0033A1374F